MRRDVHDAVARQYARSTRGVFYAPLVEAIQRRSREPVRVEIPLTTERYERWLRESGVGWVALPAAPLDDSARGEVRIIRSGPAYLQPVWDSRDWRLFRVKGSPGLTSGPGRLVRLDEDGSWSRPTGADVSSSASDIAATGMLRPATRA